MNLVFLVCFVIWMVDDRIMCFLFWLLRKLGNWRFGHQVWDSWELELNKKNNGKLLWLVGDEKF
jgi:hypothetical protein